MGESKGGEGENKGMRTRRVGEVRKGRGKIKV